MSPENISTSPASTTRRSLSPSTRSASDGPRPVVRQVVGHPDRHRAEAGARPCDVPPSNGAPTMTTSAAPRASGSSSDTRSTPRKVMSGPYCGP